MKTILNFLSPKEIHNWEIDIVPKEEVCPRCGNELNGYIGLDIDHNWLVGFVCLSDCYQVNKDGQYETKCFIGTKQKHPIHNKKVVFRDQPPFNPRGILQPQAVKSRSMGEFTHHSLGYMDVFLYDKGPDGQLLAMPIFEIYYQGKDHVHVFYFPQDIVKVGLELKKPKTDEDIEIETNLLLSELASWGYSKPQIDEMIEHIVIIYDELHEFVE